MPSTYAENKSLTFRGFDSLTPKIDDPHFVRLCYLALTLLLCLPVLFTTYVPLVDYPNHLARTDILARYHQVFSFQKNYGLLFQPIPNLAMDLIIPPIAHFTGTILAGKLFLLGLILVYALGCYLLALQIFGYDTRAAFVPLLFIYNSTFLMGYINYAAGVAVFLVTFALWLRWKDCWTIPRFAAFSALTSICYIFHLSSVAILGLCVLAVLILDLFTGRSKWTHFAISGCAALPAVSAYLAFMHGSGQMGQMQLGTISGKLIRSLSVIRGYNLTIDVVVVLGLVACVIYLILSRISLTAIPVALVPALLLFVAFVACPATMYTSAGADARFVWPAFILLALSFRVRVPKQNYTFCFTFIVALFLIRFSSIWWNWHQEDVKAGEILRMFDKLPRDAAVYPAFFNKGDMNAMKQNRGLEHLACYAVITRDAFVPSVFALTGQQPLVFKGLHRFHVWDKSNFNPNEYGYMWAFEPPRELRDWLNRSAILVAKEGDSTLWKLQHNVIGLR